MKIRDLAYRFTLIAHELAMEAWLLTGQLAHRLRPCDPGRIDPLVVETGVPGRMTKDEPS